MIDYRRLRRDDPGGTITSAFASLSTIRDSLVLDSAFITVASVSAEYGIRHAESIHKRMIHFGEANIPPDDTDPDDLPKDPYPTTDYYFPDWLIDAFGPFGNGFDIGSASTREAVSLAYTKGVFTQEQTSILLGMNRSPELRYPGLKEADIAFVRQE